LGGFVPERALRLAGKIAVVTGGGRGLGRAIALALGREGADVAISYHSSRTGAQSVADELVAGGRRAHLAPADARKPGEIGRFVNDAAKALGGIDVLVNNVGVFRRVPMEEIGDEVLDEAFAVNVKAAVAATQAAAPHMRQRGGGSVVNIASLGGIRPWRAYLPYCATKAALIMATECLALALAPDIRVNAVAPGVLDPPGAGDAVRGRIPQERFGSLEEAVESVLFLATGARYTTGEVLRVDGGRALA
jgi:NAD(P)-dependent dehydrogenase (short-subunit alcohol dehydrogenase family)